LTDLEGQQESVMRFEQRMKQMGQFDRPLRSIDAKSV
jgi:hypothetical protein